MTQSKDNELICIVINQQIHIYDHIPKKLKNMMNHLQKLVDYVYKVLCESRLNDENLI